MIQPLRKMHRGIFFALFLILPVLFVSGLLSRPKGQSFILRASPISVANLEALSKVSHQTASLAGRRLDVWIRENQTGAGSWNLQLVPDAPLVAPDVLVYWSESDATGSFPAAATCLGAFDYAKQYPLTKQEKEHGFIVLYSLAQKQVIGSFAIGNAGGKR